jgi:hypothetical protein
MKCFNIGKKEDSVSKPNSQYSLYINIFLFFVFYFKSKLIKCIDIKIKKSENFLFISNVLLFHLEILDHGKVAI